MLISRSGNQGDSEKVIKSNTDPQVTKDSGKREEFSLQAFLGMNASRGKMNLPPLLTNHTLKMVQERESIHQKSSISASIQNFHRNFSWKCKIENRVN
jgi:hypothetical protein